MNVYLLIGLPGSGKSTWSRNFVKENPNTIIINRDAYRSMIKSEYTFDLRFEPFIKSISNKSLETALEYGFDVIIDETHVKAQRRKEITSIIRNYESTFGVINNDYGRTKIVYVWLTETENNIKYRMIENRGYEKEKWEEVINNMKRIFEEPKSDEGYDELIKINPLLVKQKDVK